MSFLATAFCTPCPQTAGAATIADSVQQALASHPKIKEGEAARREANHNIIEQISGFFPVVGVSAQAGHMTNDDMTTRANTFNGGGAPSYLMGQTFTLTQPIFDSFGTLNKVDGAKERYAAAGHDLAATVGDIALAAARAHLNLMRTREFLDLAREYQTHIEERRKNISSMLDAGAANESDLLQADEIQAAAKNTRLGYEETFHQAEADYAEAVGGEPGDALTFGNTDWDAFIPNTVENAQAYAVHHNPHILSAEKMVKALANDTQAKKSGLAPTVNAEFSLDRENQDFAVGGDLTSARALLKLNWKFSLGGGELADISKSEQQEMEATDRRLDTVQKTQHDVRQKYTSMQISEQQFSISADREAYSRKILDNFLAQFEGGKQTNLQLISAYSRLFEAKIASTDAYYRYVLTRLELMNILGNLREAFGAPAVATRQKD